MVSTEKSIKLREQPEINEYLQRDFKMVEREMMVAQDNSSKEIECVRRAIDNVNAMICFEGKRSQLCLCNM